MSAVRARLPAVVLACVAVVFVLPSGGPPARAQEAAAARLDLLAQPVWHEAGDSFDLRVRITNEGTASLEGFQLVLGLYNRVQTRSALEQSHDLTTSEAPNSIPVLSLPGEELAPGEELTFKIEDPVDSFVLLSPGADNGVYPLKLTLQSALGVPLDVLSTHLIYYPSPAREDVRLNLVTVVPVNDLPARGPDGVFRAGDDGSYRLEEAVADGGWFTGLLDVLEAETEVSEPPRRRRDRPVREPPRIGLAPSARFVEELADMADGFRKEIGGEVEQVPESDPAAENAAAALARLGALLSSEEIQPVLAPYSFPDLPSVADHSGLIALQMNEAADILQRVLGRAVDTRWVFAPGGRLDGRVEREIRSPGVPLHTFLAADALEPPADPVFAGCPIETLTLACPIDVDAGAGREITGFAFDDEIQRHLLDVVHEEGHAALQRFFAETSMIREESPGIERTIHASVSPAWHPSARGWRILLRGITRAPWLRAVTPEGGLERIEARGSRRLRLEAPALDNQPLDSFYDTVDTAGALVDDFASMAPPSSLVERLRRNILTATARSWWDERQTEGLAFALETRAEVLGELRKIGTVGAAETTLTSREGRIQFVIFNDTGYEVRLQVRLDARGDLALTDPAREVRVEGNQQTVTYEVTARASGIFPITVHLESPSGYEIQAPQTITVRSTEFNEIALGLTFGALAFLVLFYVVRGFRRRRGTGESSRADAA